MKDFLKRKRILFPLIFFGQIAIVAIISLIFELETDNSPLGVAYAYIMGFTVIWFATKIIKEHKTELIDKKVPFMGQLTILGMLYTLIAVMIFVLGIITVSILTGTLAT